MHPTHPERTLILASCASPRLSRPRFLALAGLAALILSLECLIPSALGWAPRSSLFAEDAPRVAETTETTGTRSPGFVGAKTFFQTNIAYDPRIALAVDAVVVHRHGDSPASLRRVLGSWKDRGYTIGRMFFADSDATNAYWTGKWDGVPHPDDVERDSKGEVVKCAGVRPYMLPTEGWIRHLEEMARVSVDAGAEAVLPEEPLAHIYTGYEKSFQDLWVKRWGRPWQPESASEEARFLTGRLKCELYQELERRVALAAKACGRELGREIPCFLPIHSLYSNVAAKLVAPLGSTATLDMFDGYVGQIWTGPVNWALVHYDSPEKSFFTSAYALYDYFVELSVMAKKPLWLLSDPVEDDPNHSWSEFEIWYRRCVVAKMLFGDVDRFEVAPWPDRIFLPGYGTGGGTPAPERNRVAILSAVQVQQEVPRGAEGAPAETGGRIGIAVADTVLWEREAFPPLQGIYGLILPLLEEGIPVAACLLEGSGDPGYLDRFRIIVLSYEAFKPLEAKWNEDLTAWVRRGGVLVVLGAADDLDPDREPKRNRDEDGAGQSAEAPSGAGAAVPASDPATPWWRAPGCRGPLQHLLASLGGLPEGDGDHAVGSGWVLRRGVSPRTFGDPAQARSTYLPLLDMAEKKRGGAAGLQTPGHFLLRRGPFVIGHSTRAPLRIEGKLVDVFEPEFPVLDGVTLERGASGLYRDVSAAYAALAGGDSRPRVLHTTHRLLSEEWKDGVLGVRVKGPAETPAVVRILVSEEAAARVRAKARGADGKDLAVDSKIEGSTLRVKFPNDPEGALLEITIEKS